MMEFIIDPPASAFTRSPWWHTRGHFSTYQVLPALHKFSASEGRCRASPPSSHQTLDRAASTLYMVAHPRPFQRVPGSACP